MNRKKIIIFLAIVVLFIIFVIISVLKNNENSYELEDEHVDDYVYDFGDTIDLESSRGFEEYATTGTDYSSLGVTNDDFDLDQDIEYDGDKAYMMTYDGYITISSSWIDEGNAKKVKEPSFGTLEKFILKRNCIVASYMDVNMKEAITYINELSGLGYNKVRLDNKNTRADYYYYSAEKADGSFITINYENGELYLEVYG